MAGHEEWNVLLDDRASLTVTAGFGVRRLNRQAQESAAKRQRLIEGPAAQSDELLLQASERLRQWCQYGSWAVCLSCDCVHRQRLDMKHLREGTFPNTVNTCVFCAAGYLVPRAEHYPTPLALLSREQVYALRPIHLYQGNHLQDQGAFRRHTEVSKVKWSKVSVLEKIEALDQSQKQGALGAYDFLMQFEFSAYKDFVQEHERFLQQDSEPQYLPPHNAAETISRVCPVAEPLPHQSIL